jgi:hypothetical protein
LVAFCQDGCSPCTIKVRSASCFLDMLESNTLMKQPHLGTCTRWGIQRVHLDQCNDPKLLALRTVGLLLHHQRSCVRCTWCPQCAPHQ